MLVEFLGLGLCPLSFPRSPWAIFLPLCLSYFFHGCFHKMKFPYIFLPLRIYLFAIVHCKLQPRKDCVFYSSAYAHLPGTISGIRKEQLLLEPVNA